MSNTMLIEVTTHSDSSRRFIVSRLEANTARLQMGQVPPPFPPMKPAHCVCQYCGSRAPVNAMQCAACGSRKFV